MIFLRLPAGGPGHRPCHDSDAQAAASDPVRLTARPRHAAGRTGNSEAPSRRPRRPGPTGVTVTQRPRQCCSANCDGAAWARTQLRSDSDPSPIVPVRWSPGVTVAGTDRPTVTVTVTLSGRRSGPTAPAGGPGHGHRGSDGQRVVTESQPNVPASDHGLADN
jgi:hypothetical protein